MKRKTKERNKELVIEKDWRWKPNHTRIDKLQKETKRRVLKKSKEQKILNGLKRWQMTSRMLKLKRNKIR